MGCSSYARVAAALCAALLCAMASLALGAEFHEFKECQPCLDAGFGWCPIRRKCGGFANRACSGTETDKQFPLVVEVKSAGQFEKAAFDPKRTLFALLSGGRASGLSNAYDEAFHAAAHGVIKTSSNAVVAFASIDCEVLPTVCAGRKDMDAEAPPAVISFRRIPFGSQAPPPLPGSEAGGFDSPAAEAQAAPKPQHSFPPLGDTPRLEEELTMFMLGELAAAKANIHSLDVLAREFMKAYIAGNLIENDGSRAVVERTQMAVDELAAALASVDVDAEGKASGDGWGDDKEASTPDNELPEPHIIGEFYVQIMALVHERGPTYLAHRTNELRYKGSMLSGAELAEMEVLDVFVGEMF